MWIFFDAEKDQQTPSMSLSEAQVYLQNLPENKKNTTYIWTPSWEKWKKIADYLNDSSQNYFSAKPISPPNTSLLLKDVINSIKNKKKSSAEHTKSVVHTKIEQLKPTEVDLSQQDYSSGTKTGTTTKTYTEVLTLEDIPATFKSSYDQGDFNGDDLRWNEEDAKPRLISTKKTGTAKSERRRDPRHDFKIKIMLVTDLKTWKTYSRDISLGGTLLEEDVPKDFLNQPFDLILVNPLEKDEKKAKLYFRGKIVGDLMDPKRLMFIEKSPQMGHQLKAMLAAYMTYLKELQSAA
jgi:hypothetical protein